MKTYIVKTYDVVVKGTTEVRYTHEDSAHIALSYWTGDQGEKDAIIVENYEECVMIEDTVYIPENIYTF